MVFDKILLQGPLASGYIDIHSHRSVENGMLGIVSIDALDFISKSVNDTFYSLGIHPWYIQQQDWQAGLAKIVDVGDAPNLLAIGECGLDKCIDTPMALQIEVFSRQIELAEALGKPLIVHCVRAFNEMLDLKKSLAPNQPWILHGFTGKPAQGKQLLRQGCYLSFGKALLHEGGHVGRTLAETPIDRIFLETDAAEDVSIGAIYAAAAKITGLDVSNLQRHIVANFHRVFIHD